MGDIDHNWDNNSRMEITSLLEEKIERAFYLILIFARPVKSLRVREAQFNLGELTPQQATGNEPAVVVQKGNMERMNRCLFF
jgi:hypothetical protein